MENTQLSLFGKTSPEPSVATKVRTSASSAKSSSKSSSRQPLCLVFHKKGGTTPTVTSETDGRLLTEFLTLNTGECPNVVEESTLSQILEVNAPERYYLSAKACEGILRRAERRGKQLPPMLKEALEQMIEREKGSTDTTETSQETSPQPLESTADYQADEMESSNEEDGPADTLVATDYKDPQLVAYESPRPAHTITAGSFTQIEEEKAPTLMARDYKDPTCVETYDPNTRKYIVRRLTPTECARLQGFADWHGHLEKKTFLTDAEFKFWTDVRNTHAAINGKKEQEYTRKQMLTWYNKLWTDSAEYKMWGNGIALPTALYAIQGIADALDAAEMIADELNGAEELIEDWML